MRKMIIDDTAFLFNQWGKSFAVKSVYILCELYTNLTIPEPDPLFDQAVNLVLFEDLLKGYFKDATPH